MEIDGIILTVGAVLVQIDGIILVVGAVIALIIVLKVLIWLCRRVPPMTKEQAVETYAGDLFKKEYFGFDVRFPTDQAEIEIKFPQGYNVRAFPGVFLAASETWHDLELQRIKEGIKPTSRGARLKIKEPRIGYRYLIFWVPLSRKEVEQLRSRQGPK